MYKEKGENFEDIMRLVNGPRMLSRMHSREL